ncbi:MAG: Sjogren's syndrome/scleroderma autoantigen 1 family protein [Candidatus Thorarchaeota archaeon]
MADLLRSGYTMLNIACPVCNNPIFQNKNKNKFCPTCNRDVLVVDNKTSQIHEKIEKGPIQEDPGIIEDNNLTIPNFKPLKEVILKQIRFLTEKLNSESQLDLIERYTDLLSKFIEIWKKISLN